MDNLLERLGTLKSALLHELEEILSERGELLRLFPARSRALLARAAGRSAFHRASAQQQEAIHEALREACAAQQLPAPSVSALAAALGLAGRGLQQLYAEVTSLAKRYAQEEEITRQILERTLLCVSSYLAALSPRPAYDRRGAMTQARPLSTLSTRI